MAKMEVEVVKTILLAKQQLPEVEIEKYQKFQGSIMPKGGTRNCCTNACASMCEVLGKVCERLCFCCL
ncbi:unnamed protein product [Cuscuta campestris]|uniref:Uncharacterized protein n=1 Tax=Cuscuta campestris TaxID=132261 RepID=A0A484N4F9_9ASTE|nr:unnamed protein product [Cuscuta campestris]